VKSRDQVVKAVETETQGANTDETEVENSQLGALNAIDSSLFGLIKTLLSVKTLPHLLALVIASVLLYALADGQAGMAAVGFTSLSFGYAATAVLSNFEGVRSWTHLKKWGEERPPLMKRLLWSARILALPYGTAGVFSIAFILFTSENASTFLALALAGLFVVWAVAQGRSFAGWASAIAARKIPPSSPKNGNGYLPLTLLALIVIGFGMICITAYASIQSPSAWIMPPVGDLAIFTTLSLGAFVLMNTMTWSKRRIAMADKALRRFHFRWSLLIHLFVTWHILTVYRHAAMSPGDLEVYIEEIALMVFTVFMGIWALTSRGFGSELKLLNTDNALPWGLAFGYAYAGSVAMISSVVDDFQSVMMIGHIIAALTGISMHRSVMRKVLVRHDENEEIQRIVSTIEPAENLADTNQKDTHKAGSSSPNGSSKVSTNNAEEWGGALDTDWEEPKDIGLKAEVEWEDVINIED
jgi:hypothetical protein